MHDVAETLGIVEAFAEHDFPGKRLSEMIRASGREDIICYVYCQHI